MLRGIGCDDATTQFQSDGESAIDGAELQCDLAARAHHGAVAVQIEGVRERLGRALQCGLEDGRCLTDTKSGEPRIERSPAACARQPRDELPLEDAEAFGE